MVQSPILAPAQWQALKELASQIGVPFAMPRTPLRNTKGKPDFEWWVPQPAEALALLQDWKSLFSIAGISYPTLNRTLMNLPKGVPSELVCDLNQIWLSRPLTDLLEFLVATTAASLVKRHRPLFLAARREEILRALRLVSAHLRENFSPNSDGDICYFVQFLSGYPEEHHGNIVGLARKSIHWHRQERKRKLEDILHKLGPET